MKLCECGKAGVLEGYNFCPFCLRNKGIRSYCFKNVKEEKKFLEAEQIMFANLEKGGLNERI